MKSKSQKIKFDLHIAASLFHLTFLTNPLSELKKTFFNDNFVFSFAKQSTR